MSEHSFPVSSKYKAGRGQWDRSIGPSGDVEDIVVMSVDGGDDDDDDSVVILVGSVIETVGYIFALWSFMTNCFLICC